LQRPDPHADAKSIAKPVAKSVTLAVAESISITESVSLSVAESESFAFTIANADSDDYLANCNQRVPYARA
jgi:hypothetical protein